MDSDDVFLQAGVILGLLLRDQGCRTGRRGGRSASLPRTRRHYPRTGGAPAAVNHGGCGLTYAEPILSDKVEGVSPASLGEPSMATTTTAPPAKLLTIPQLSSWKRGSTQTRWRTPLLLQEQFGFATNELRQQSRYGLDQGKGRVSVRQGGRASERERSINARTSPAACFVSFHQPSWKPPGGSLLSANPLRKITGSNPSSSPRSASHGWCRS